MSDIQRMVTELVETAQRQAIERAKEMGAVSLDCGETTLTPDEEGGYVMKTEWIVGVPRG